MTYLLRSVFLFISLFLIRYKHKFYLKILIINFFIGFLKVLKCIENCYFNVIEVKEEVMKIYLVVRLPILK